MNSVDGMRDGMGDGMTPEVAGSLRSAVITVKRGVLLPTLMACPDLPELLQLVDAAYFYRLVQDNSRFKIAENFQSGRSEGTEDRARLLVRDLFTPYILYVMEAASAMLRIEGGTARDGSRFPMEVFDGLLRHAGLHLGIQERNRLLSRLQDEGGQPRWDQPRWGLSRPADGEAPLDSADAPQTGDALHATPDGARLAGDALHATPDGARLAGDALHATPDGARLAGDALQPSAKLQAAPDGARLAGDALQPSAKLQAAPDGALFCFLGALVPVVVQRFQAVPGSLLWYGEQTLPPEEMRAFLQKLEAELVSWLEVHAVRYDAIPKGSEDAYGLLELSALGGVPAPIAWSAATPAWARLLCATVGGDLAVRIGNLDQATAVLQRATMDAAYERFQTVRQSGDRVYDFIPRHYRVMSRNTITKWRRGPNYLEDAERSPINGGFAGAAAIQIAAILAAVRPGMISKARLLAQLRERCRGPMASPEIADMALHLLHQQDRIVWKKSPRREDLYGLREAYVTMTAERLKEMQVSLERDLNVLPGLVRANAEGHPGGHVFSHRRWIRRTHLEGSQETIRQIRERVREQFTRKYDDLSKEEARAMGIEECRAFLLSRVTPVPPR